MKRAAYVFLVLLAFTFLSGQVVTAGPVLHMPVDVDTRTDGLANPLAPVHAAASQVHDEDSSVHANEIAAHSAIKAVTVYTDRAKVTREAVIDLPAGAHSVVFHGLPAILLPDSLRAEGTSKANVKFGAVASKQIMAAQLAAPREKQLNDQLEALHDQQNLLQAGREALEQKKEFLENLGKDAHMRADENIAQIDLKPEQWAAAAQTVYGGINEILTAEQQIIVKDRTLEKQINQIIAELSQLSTGKTSTFDVTVPLESDEATSLTIDLSYQVPDATWHPLYDARLETEGEKLALTEYGAVSQKTGEDWKGAALTLSTAQPQRGASLPDLTPLWVDAHVPYSYGNNFSQLREAPAAAASNVSSEYVERIREKNTMGKLPITDAGVSTEDPQERWRRIQDERTRRGEFVTAQIQTGGFVTEYKIPGPATVASDGTETKLMVGTFDTDNKIEIHIKPQLSTDAFLVAKTKLKGESPALPGQVSLFRDGAYVGQDALPLLRPGEEYALFFGVDDQVAVKRKVLKDEKGEAGIITKDSVLERDFVTELQNLHTRPVEVVVKETVPAGRNDKITVEVLPDSTTAGYQQDAANIKGMLQWQFTLAPKEKKNLNLGWKVSWPKDMSLSGL